MIQGWQKKRLQDVCKLFTDGNWIESKDQATEGIRLIQTGNIGLGEYREKAQNARYISEDTFNRLKCTEIFAGDLLVSRLPEPVGRSCIIPNIHSRMITAVDCTIIRPSDELAPHFLKYYQLSNTYLKHVDEKTTGTTRSRISRKNLGQIFIPVPPIPEQKRIVAKLDQAFEAIDKAKANVERNLQNAKDLFQSKLNEIFSQRGEGWVEKKLGKISDIVYGYTAKASHDSGSTKYLRITDIQDKKVDWDSVPFCDIDESEFPKYRLIVGDIVFARTGATTGKSYLITNPPKAIFASYLIRVQINTEELNTAFLYLFFQSGIYWESIIKGISGSAQGGFNASKLKELEITYPLSSIVQAKYVNEMDDIVLQIEALRNSYNEQIASLDELKKSILQKAFNGEL